MIFCSLSSPILGSSIAAPDPKLSGEGDRRLLLLSGLYINTAHEQPLVILSQTNAVFSWAMPLHLLSLLQIALDLLVSLTNSYSPLNLSRHAVSSVKPHPGDSLPTVTLPSTYCLVLKHPVWYLFAF